MIDIGFLAISPYLIIKHHSMGSNLLSVDFFLIQYAFVIVLLHQLKTNI